MSYPVDSGSQKYYRKKNGLVEASPIAGVFNSESSSYDVDTGSQKYYTKNNGLVDKMPKKAIFAVVAPASSSNSSNFFMFFN